MIQFRTIFDMELNASGEEDETSNCEMQHLGKFTSYRHWLRVVHEGQNKFSYFHDAGRKTHRLTRDTASKFLQDERSYRANKDIP